MRTYLRYEQEGAWGVITSQGDIAVDHTGKLAVAPALESVAVWNLRTGALAQHLRPGQVSAGVPPAEVTALTLGADGDTLAVGHADGSIRLWSLSEGLERLTLNGHKAAVCVLRLNRASTVLVSGARDTAVVVWDIVAETGICRLRGHRDAVTDLCLLEVHTALASVSKDGSLRLWDLHTQHCVQNVSAPSNELWSVDADEACQRLITGGAKAELIAWQLESTTLAASLPEAAVTAASSGSSIVVAKPSADGAGSSDSEWKGVRAVQLGPLGVKASTARVARLRFGLGDTLLCVQFADRNLCLYSVQSEAQLKRQVKRRVTKKRKGGGADEDNEGGASATLSAADCYLPLTHVKGSSKLQAFAFMPRQKAAAAAAASAGDDDNDDAAGPAGSSSASRRDVSARLLLSDKSNVLAVHACELRQGGASEVVSSVMSPGHRTEPRALALSPDERTVLSASDGEAKLWSVKSQQCTATFECGYALTACFLLASKYVAVGSKDGKLHIYSVASSELVCEVDAHANAVWSLVVQPGGTALLSGGADKTVALWRPIEGGGGGGGAPNTLTLEEIDRHEMSDDVLSCAFTPNAKHIACALLDNSIRVVFADSFDLFLTLYGHSLPALSISTSSDNSLLVSGSADKTIKIWGLDFGDCHRSLHGHSEPVMCVSFVRETHFFFSASKDKTIRYWDGDKFDQILLLRAHHAEVWQVVPSRSGSMIVTASRDRSLRIWRRTDEQVNARAPQAERPSSLLRSPVPVSGSGPGSGHAAW